MRRVAHAKPLEAAADAYRQMVADHSVMGHGDVNSQFDEALAKSTARTLAFLLGGVGDARHLYATIAHIAKWEKTSNLSPLKAYHFTIIDAQPTVLVRNILILFLIHEVSEMHESNASGRIETLAAIYFLYCAHLVPPSVYDRLQATIKYIISVIQSPSGIFAWLYLREQDKDAFVEALRSWEVDALKSYNTKYIREGIIKGVENQTIKLNLPNDGGCLEEKSVFQDTAMLFPPPFLLNYHEPKLKKLLETHTSSKTKSSSVGLVRCLDQKWKTNVTLIDVKVQNNRVRCTCETCSVLHILCISTRLL